ncbi:MAG: hypothetical protein ACI31G_04025 [Bacilli bacterium]
MKAKTKTNLSNIFGSLFSNAKAIEAGKTLPWWMALISFLLAVFIPIIPIMVQTANSYGSQFIAKTTYGLEKSLTSSTIDLYLNGYEFKINEDHHLIGYKDDNQLNPTVEEDKIPLIRYINSETNMIDLEIYYSVRSTSAKENSLSDLLDSIKSKTYILNSINEEDNTATSEEEEESTSEEEIVKYRPSYIIMYKEGIYACLMKANSTESSATSGGNWAHHSVGLSLLSDLLTVKDGDNNVIVTLENKNELLVNETYLNGVFNNWKKSFDLSYLTSRSNSLTTSTLVFLGIYILLSFFMGLMLFLLTRGKKNPFRYLSFFTCQKINAWSSFCPALLAMILGFMLSNYAVMFFIALLGLRTMWMSMRQLRPQY